MRVEDYGPGRIRPHERTHPGPREDRLRLTRATKANLSPIFSLYSDPEGARVGRARAATAGGAVRRGDRRRRHRATGSGGSPTPTRSRRSRRTLEDAELLIADGHHRYETARVYADEIGGEGEHRYVLMCLVALEDPGLTVFPTHRLVRDTTSQTAGGARRRAARSTSTSTQIEHDELRPPDGDGPLTMGYIDAHFKRAVPPHAQGPGDRRPRPRRLRPSPTAGSTPRCSRR